MIQLARQQFIADFHIHSHYSRATSKNMNIVSLNQWGQLKGIAVMGTGDFTHPRWFKEMQEKLEPAEPGLFRLKSIYDQTTQLAVPPSCRQTMRFLLTVEISCIYKKNDRVRKMHCLVLAPSFTAAAKINTALQTIGNLTADGRPILGLDAKELLKIVLMADDQAMLIPAHAWTPHFSVFGSKSGFDTLTEAFDDLTKHIYAIETGLSSDPAMNWRLSQLDNIALVSNSDAHSPGKLGREANVFDTELSYAGIITALRTNDPTGFESTIEFFPEEGKYHLDGHRTCQVKLEPTQSQQHQGLCPRCGQPLTIGVLNRVQALADRPIGAKPNLARPFTSIIPLPEIIAEIFTVSPSSKRVVAEHHRLLAALGNEFSILLTIPLAQIAAHSTPILAEAIKRMRAGQVHRQGGYDGEYGVITVFTAEERAALNTAQQRSLF
ncbi:MAG: DNA helicase UvrD [Candidatus Kerfeldbacteria bacterium]|nr:DNA helicase UvrD [Candidatus Kerfeldbacteria bacterium]